MIVDEFKHDPLLLEVLYQWASNPTSASAVKRKLFPKHDPFIIENLVVRYGINRRDVARKVEQVKKKLESLNVNFL